MNTGQPVPAIAVILATDRYETIRPVIECLRAQTVRDRLEILIATPDRASLGLPASGLDGFAEVRVVEGGSLEQLASGRAAAVRVARAPLVFIGETHSYPHSGWAEALLRAHAAGWTVVLPGFGNANPDTALSWALFLLDYGRAVQGLPAGEMDVAPTHNASYQRAALLELGPALETALRHGDELTELLRARGFRSYFEPAARIDHVNVSRLGNWLHERFLGGLLIAGHRAQRWPWRRRLLYFAGSPLIPAVLVARLLNRLRRASPWPQVPAATLPWVLVGAIVSSVGEMTGYALAWFGEAERRMTEYEVNKVRYTAQPVRLPRVAALSNSA